MPAIGQILIVFMLMLVLSRLRLPLGLAIALGGLALNLWAGRPPAVVATDVIRAALSPELWMFVAITALIIEVGRFVTQGRNSDEILAATRRWGGRHGATCTLMAVPAVIGLIPMPAGALFSAPFVQQAGKTIGGRPEWKAAVNYWFRHIWEYWWPLYPGVIIAMSVFEMDAAHFIGAEVLYTPVAALAGYVFLVRPHVGSLAGETEGPQGSNRRALFLLSPLAVVVLALLIVPPWLIRCCPELGVQSRKLLALLFGLLVAVGIILWDEKRAGCHTRVFSTLLKKKSLSVLFTLAGVLVFKSLLRDSGLLPRAGGELIDCGIPLVVAVAALPFLAGLVTGLAVGFTGTSFPLVVGLMSAPGSGLSPLATLVLAFGFGYAGMILSPVHLCFLVTNDYFHASITAVYRLIAPCVLSVLAYALVAHAVLHLAGR